MKARTTYLRLHLSMALALCSLLATYAQDTPTYTVDPNFTTGNLFRAGSGIGSLVLYEDGRILAGGGFSPFVHWSPFNGLGMVWADGSEFTDWGGGENSSVPQVVRYLDGFIAPLIGGLGKYTENGTPTYILNGHAWIEYLWEPGFGNPYNVKSMWCVYVQEDDKVLIGGAVATDTTQPYLYRNLMRVLPDGSHDTTFPAIEIEPNIQYTKIREIHKDSQGRWIVSGDFWAVNGHETAYVARLNQDFSVDTGFTSPLQYVFSLPEPVVKLLDSQDRMWMSGRLMVTYDNPSDTINILRILPSGETDATFVPTRLEEVYPGINQGGATQVYGGLELEGSGHYILFGKFNYFNDTLQPCITVVDDSGYIQHNYFQGDGATEHNYFASTIVRPSVGAVKELPDGSLIVGGAFSKFMGATHYNMIKLNRGTIGTTDRGKEFPLTVHPNPATNHFWLSAPGAHNAEVYIHDLAGRTVYRGTLTGETARISTAGLSPGMYLVYVQDERGTAVRKIVVEGKP